MTFFLSFVAEVEEAVAGQDAHRRAQTLRQLTDFFLDQEPRLSEEHVAVFDEVMLRLSRDLEQRARLELSECFSVLLKAPRKVVRSLAFDHDGAVARPVLERSTRLDDDDLIMIARGRGRDHLLAISKRANVSERVTDVIVHRGDQGVVRTVAGNGGARFSRNGMGHLLNRSREDATLHGLLTGRGDLPPEEMRRLLEIAQEAARRAPRMEWKEAASSAMDAALAEAARAGLGRAAPEDFTQALAEIGRKTETPSGLTEEDVAAWLRQGRLEEALAALAQLAGVPLSIVARAYRSPHHDPLLFLLRAARFDWSTFKLFLAARTGGVPTADVLRAPFEAFQQLSVSTAQRVVRFTAARERSLPSQAA